ncbi:MAG: hypothetical protein ACRDS0_35025 [Pseudonocardiaceae bacterium]
MSRRKDVGAAAGVDDIAAALGNRYPTEPEEQSQRPGNRATGKRGTTRRSWLLPTEVVTAFTQAADRIHHGSGGRIRKSDAQAAIIRLGLDHLDDINRYLASDQIDTPHG